MEKIMTDPRLKEPRALGDENIFSEYLKENMLSIFISHISFVTLQMSLSDKKFMVPTVWIIMTLVIPRVISFFF